MNTITKGTKSSEYLSSEQERPKTITITFDLELELLKENRISNIASSSREMLRTDDVNRVVERWG